MFTRSNFSTHTSFRRSLIYAVQLKVVFGRDRNVLVKCCSKKNNVTELKLNVGIQLESHERIATLEHS